MTIDTNRLRALLAAGTPGPWRACGKDRGGWGHRHQGRLNMSMRAHLRRRYLRALHRFHVRRQTRLTPDADHRKANALLIAETVSALPELLDAIDAMRAELEENEGVMKVLRRRASSSRAEALAEAVAACEDNGCANCILAIEGA